MGDRFHDVIREVEAKGFVFVAESVLPVESLFALSKQHGYGFSMEPWESRRTGSNHPLITKKHTALIINEQVQRIRELEAELRILRRE